MNPDASQAQQVPHFTAVSSAPPGYAPQTDGQTDFASTAAAALYSAPPTVGPSSQPQNNAPAPSRPPRKRKPALPGSRGVATLTPEQLAKKRANDREAQRAIRERTKSTIESLEQRIKELETQQPYQELQRALTERDRARSECEELRQRLSAVAGIVGNSNIGQRGLNELAALTAQQPPMPSASEQDVTQHYDVFSKAQRETGAAQSPSLAGYNGLETQTSNVQQQQQQLQQHLHPDLRASPTADTAKSFSPG